jgi:galactonate dehydratase
VDIALWDIKGKRLQTPVYELLGGKCRDKARVYIHIQGESPEELAESAREAVREGFTAVRFAPFARDYYRQRHGRLLQEGVARVAAVREAVGPDVDVCVEIHRRMSIPEAVAFAEELKPYRPFFCEDPITPDSVESMAEVARKTSIPIATGERLHTIYEFRELLQMRAAQYIRPDLCLAGGLTHCKKIAAVAESFNVGVIPHNPLSPVSTAVCIQLDACIPNFVLQEYTGEDKPPKSLMVHKPLTLQDGYLLVPEEPGIGVELNDDFLRTHQWEPRPIDTPVREDGSVADR